MVHCINVCIKKNKCNEFGSVWLDDVCDVFTDTIGIEMKPGVCYFSFFICEYKIFLVSCVSASEFNA